MTTDCMINDAVCVIPARGGSKRIPRKNIRVFNGKPMMAWPIETAKRSSLFREVIVSTDDAEIRDVALQYGASVPFNRPPALADDQATTDMVLVHVLDWLKEHDRLPRYLCCIYPCTPLLTEGDLSRGLDVLASSGATTAFSVVTYGHPIFRALKVNEQGRLDMFWPEHRLTRSQDLPEAWHDAGQFYWLDVQRYLRESHIFSSNSVPVPMPGWRAIDIDTEDDWRRAELIQSIEKK